MKEQTRSTVTTLLYDYIKFFKLTQIAIICQSFGYFIVTTFSFSTLVAVLLDRATYIFVLTFAWVVNWKSNPKIV